MPHITQTEGLSLLLDPGSLADAVKTYRKKARIVAIKMLGDFTVDTDRGVMTGVAGDFLVTNHPDDDPGSDVWSISAERMANTYEETT